MELSGHATNKLDTYGISGERLSAWKAALQALVLGDDQRQELISVMWTAQSALRFWKGSLPQGCLSRFFVCHFYRLFAQGQFSLLDLLGPNTATLAAMQELEDGGGVASNSIDELFADLHAED